MTLNDLIRKAKAAGLNEYSEIEFVKEDYDDLASNGSLKPLTDKEVKFIRDGLYGDKIRIEL